MASSALLKGDEKATMAIKDTYRVVFMVLLLTHNI